MFVLDEVMSDRNLLRTILENHILKFKITLSELYNGQLLETLAGKLLRVFIYRTVRATRLYLSSHSDGSYFSIHRLTFVKKLPTASKTP